MTLSSSLGGPRNIAGNPSLDVRQLVGARLRTLRGQLSQGELSVRSGVSDGTISAIERGESDPRLGTLLRLVEALDLCSVEEFLGPLPSRVFIERG